MRYHSTLLAWALCLSMPCAGPAPGLIAAASTSLVLAGCSRGYDVGDHLMIAWEGDVYPAMVIEVVGAGRLRVHYDGYDDMWDEVVPRSRIKGRVEGSAATPNPPAKVLRAATNAGRSNQFKVGDRVLAQWHGARYRAVIIAINGPERYRVHYEGYGDEWDENLGATRLVAQ